MTARDVATDHPLPPRDPRPCRVCVVTGHDLIGDLISSALTIRDIDVVRAPEPNFDDVVRSHRGCDLDVICSWGLPRRGRHLTRSLVSADPSTRIVVIDDCPNADAASPLLAAGAMTVIGRHVSLIETVRVIEAAIRGDSTLITSSASARADESATFRANRHGIEEVRALSMREIEILQLAVDGVDTTTMARRLYLSEKTVKHHLSAIYSKLKVANRTDAVLRALRLGLVDLRAD
jgi:DNA-binding NarL/FixJ family response regulator